LIIVIAVVRHVRVLGMALVLGRERCENDLWRHEIAACNGWKGYRPLPDADDMKSTPRRVIRSASSTVRRAFANWLATEWRAGARLIVLEGLSDSGKTTLTKSPFLVDGKRSLNIAIDQFFPADTAMPTGSTYLDAINQQSLQARLRKALASAASVVVAEGPMAWPLIEPIAAVSRDRIRRVYLKRVMRLQPDVWTDEVFVNDPTRWPPANFRRSIYRYHNEQRPWLDADLVLERIMTTNEPP
jgi:hypothetical protein